MDAPEALRAWVPALFDEPARPFYAQAATLGPDGTPEVRTVHVRFVKAWDALGFVAHRASPKWAQLTRDPRLALCGYLPRLGLQLRLKARAALHRPGEPGADELWAGTVDWLKAEFKTRDNFGAVRLEALAWDAYRADPAHPENNERTVWTPDGGSWKAATRGALL